MNSRERTASVLPMKMRKGGEERAALRKRMLLQRGQPGTMPMPPPGATGPPSPGFGRGITGVPPISGATGPPSPGSGRGFTGVWPLEARDWAASGEKGSEEKQWKDSI